MSVNPTLYCPIRGQLNVRAKTSDGLRFTEEKRRIDCIRHLINKGYRPERMKIESTLFRFGSEGRNSFRTDLVVFNQDARSLEDASLDEQREAILLLGEIKRDNKDAATAKETQVKPALAFVPNLNTVGLYWDDVEQRVFYKRIRGNRQQLIEAPLTYLPEYGQRVEVTKLRYNDLETLPELLPLFKRIEDAIHPYIADVSVRYELVLQLILIKIFDEGMCKFTNGEMQLQDFGLFDLDDNEVAHLLNDVLGKALNVYQKYLPKQVGKRLPKAVTPVLQEISQYLAPINLLESNPEAIQSFYMYFAKQLYRWNLAQHFTPYEVVDFIVRLANPQYGEMVKDPACGSADFLISAHRQMVQQDPRVGDKLFGADNSTNAVQISVLNMLLNGDGKSNIVEEDSLVHVNDYANQFDVLLCNPPFGVRIREKRPKVLDKFDLGRGQKSQQTGILFAELCVKQVKPGGRVAIIMPNGYLGNRSNTYLALREWLLRHTKVACIIGFPRFTFKKSGADVSASVLILEKRDIPLARPQDAEAYPVYVNLLENVGWNIGNKKAKKIYKRNASNGALLLDQNNEPILDADFDAVLSDLYASPAIQAFPWLAPQHINTDRGTGWVVTSRQLLEDPYLTLDPKRWNRKYHEVVEAIEQQDHLYLLDVCDVVPASWKGKKSATVYRYVEIGSVNEAFYTPAELRGWELPSRAKCKAQPGDIFIGSVWSSVSTWFVAGPDAADGNLIVTNGFHQLRLKEGQRRYLPDLIFALSSEFYRVQMRALATGSDGLAEVSPEDLAHVCIPLIKEPEVRERVERYITQFIENSGSLSNVVATALAEHFPKLCIAERKTHASQV